MIRLPIGNNNKFQNELSIIRFRYTTKPKYIWLEQQTSVSYYYAIRSETCFEFHCTL